MLKVKYVLFHHLVHLKLNLSLFCYQQIKQYVCLKIFKPSSNVQELQSPTGKHCNGVIGQKSRKKEFMMRTLNSFFLCLFSTYNQSLIQQKEFYSHHIQPELLKKIEFCNVWMVKNILVVHDSRKKSFTYEGVKSKILLLSYEASKSKICCRCFMANSNMRCCLYLIGST